MSSSGVNRSFIFEELESVTVKYGYEYHTISDTSKYFIQPEQPFASTFKQKLEAISGTCILSKNLTEAIKEVKRIVGNELIYCSNEDLGTILFEHNIPFDSNLDFAEKATFSITFCEALSTRTASVLVSSAQIKGRRAIASPETHIVLGYESQLYSDFPEAFDFIEKKYEKSFPSQFTVITGPSRTADIEKTLVLGAHGPKDLIVIIIQDSKKK